MFDFLASEFSKVCPIERNKNLKEITSFKIGGIAPIFVKPRNLQELLDVLEICNKMNVKFICLGACTNVLINENLLNSVIISTLNLNKLSISKNGFVYCQAGVRLAKLVQLTAFNGLTGLEWAIGIPGSVGGAVFMNAGAFNGQISDNILFVEFWNGEKLVKLKKEELFFEYRSSIFTKSKNCVIINIGFSLKGDLPLLCQERIKEKILIRAKTQSVGYPSAGSVFKKTTELPPAFMIEQCGLKGLRVGGAEVSKVHSGYIVNVGNATFYDVLELIDLVRERVFEKYNVYLSLEIILI